MLHLGIDDSLESDRLPDTSIHKTSWSEILALFFTSLSTFIIIDIVLEAVWLTVFAVFTYRVDAACDIFHSYGSMVVGMLFCLIGFQLCYYFMAKRFASLVGVADIKLELMTESFLLFFVMTITTYLWVRGVTSLGDGGLQDGCTGMYYLILVYLIGMAMEFICVILFIISFLIAYKCFRKQV